MLNDIYRLHEEAKAIYLCKHEGCLSSMKEIYFYQKLRNVYLKEKLKNIESLKKELVEFGVFCYTKGFSPGFELLGDEFLEKELISKIYQVPRVRSLGYTFYRNLDLVETMTLESDKEYGRTCRDRQEILFFKYKRMKELEINDTKGIVLYILRKENEEGDISFKTLETYCDFRSLSELELEKLRRFSTLKNKTTIDEELIDSDRNRIIFY